MLRTCLLIVFVVGSAAIYINLEASPTQIQNRGHSQISYNLAVSAFFENKDRIYLSRSGEPLKVLRTFRNGEGVTPRFSPDGKKLAFSEHDGTDLEIMVLDFGTGILKQITDDDFDDVMPAWSPDSSRLAWTKTPCRCIDGANASEIWASPWPGFRPMRMTENRRMDVYPTFTSDGERIVFESGDVKEFFGIFTVSWSDKKEVAVVYEPDSSANGIPDVMGDYVLFERADRESKLIYFNAVFDLSKFGNEIFRPTAWAALGANPTPRFSPDGKFIASHRLPAVGGRSEVVISPFIRPGEPKPTGKAKEVVAGGEGHILRLPRWSRDSKYLLVQPQPNSGLAVVDLTGAITYLPMPGIGRGQKFMEIWNHDIH